MTNKKNKEEKNNNVVYIIMGVILLLAIGFFLMNGDDSQTNNDGGNNVPDEQDSNNENSNNLEAVSEDGFEGLNEARFEFPKQIKLFEQETTIKAIVDFDLDSDNKENVQFVIEEIGGDFKKESWVLYSRTGDERIKEIVLNLNDKEDIGAHRFKAYMMLNKEIVLEKEFEVEVIGEYAFAKDLTASVKQQDGGMYITINNFYGDWKDKTTFTLKSNNENIYSETRYAYRNGVRIGWMSNDPKADKYTNLINPTISIYDEERGLYIVEDLPLNIIN